MGGSNFFDEIHFDEQMVQMQLTVGHGHVLYTGGADGTDQIAENMALTHGMQVEVIVPPNHPHTKFTSPASVEVLMQANGAIGAAAHKLNKRIPTHFYTLSLLQRNYHIAREAHTVYAFGKLQPGRQIVEGGTGWTVQSAIDQGKEVFLFDTQTKQWFRQENHYHVENGILKKDSMFYPWSEQHLPILHQSSAVVGSRDIDQQTQEEIKNLFNRTFCAPENIEQVQEELNDLSI